MDERIMGLLDFQKVLQQLQGRTKTIALHIWGDPLTLLNIEEYLQIALASNLKVRLVTSGTPLKLHFPILLNHQALYQLSISLNSIVQLSKAKQDTYFQTIWDWCEYHKKNKLQPFINLRLWKKPNEKNHFIKEILELINSNFNVNIPLDFGVNSSYQLAPRIRFIGSRYFEWPSQNAPMIPPSSCHGLSSQLGILSDLRVVPCCMDGKGEMELGSLKDKNLNEILDSKRARAIKEGFKNGHVIEPTCLHCGFRQRFVV